MGKGFEEFAEKMKTEMERLCAGRMAVSLKDTVKNNGAVRKSLVVEGKGGRTAVVIHLERLYETFRKGRTAEELAREIYQEFERGREAEDTIMDRAENIDDYEFARERIVYRLVNYERNGELLKGIPHIRFCDLAVIFCISVNIGDGFCVSSMVNEKNMRKWQLNAEVMFRLAAENTPRIFPAQITSIEEDIEEMGAEHMVSREEEAFLDDMYVPLTDSPLYAMSNTVGLDGAAVILYPGVLKAFADETGGDLVIFPSSVHEVVLTPWKPDLDMVKMRETVRDINQSEVPVEEILSDQVYIYRRDTDQVTQVFGEEQKAEAAGAENAEDGRQKEGGHSAL